MPATQPFCTVSILIQNARPGIMM
nr:unnamed protein product [Callosobruchus analis]